MTVKGEQHKLSVSVSVSVGFLLRQLLSQQMCTPLSCEQPIETQSESDDQSGRRIFDYSSTNSGAAL